MSIILLLQNLKTQRGEEIKLFGAESLDRMQKNNDEILLTRTSSHTTKSLQAGPTADYITRTKARSFQFPLLIPLQMSTVQTLQGLYPICGLTDTR